MQCVVPLPLYIPGNANFIISRLSEALYLLTTKIRLDESENHDGLRSRNDDGSSWSLAGGGEIASRAFMVQLTKCGCAAGER